MRVAITRPRSALTQGWHAMPVTSRSPIPSGIAAVADALRVGNADWIAVTSPFVFHVLESNGIALPRDLHLACVGEATAAAAPRDADFIGPPPASAEAMVRSFPRGTGRVLFPCSVQASTVLEEGLRDLGYSVDRVDIYRSEDDPAGVAALASLESDAVIVTAGSAARSIAAHWPSNATLPPLIAIGEPTAHALHAARIPAAATSATPDRNGLEACLERISRDSSTA